MVDQKLACKQLVLLCTSKAELRYFELTPITQKPSWLQTSPPLKRRAPMATFTEESSARLPRESALLFIVSEPPYTVHCLSI